LGVRSNSNHELFNYPHSRAELNAGKAHAAGEAKAILIVAVFTEPTNE